MVAYVLSFIIRLALSRQREYLADAGSVELTKNPDAMISALRKIEGRGELPGATSAVMEMCVDNPREGFGELFDTHPTVENRVAALIKFAGGHDPGPIALPAPAARRGRSAPAPINRRRAARGAQRRAAQTQLINRSCRRARLDAMARPRPSPSRSLGSAQRQLAAMASQFTISTCRSRPRRVRKRAAHDEASKPGLGV